MVSMCISTAQARTKWSWWNHRKGLVEILVRPSLAHRSFWQDVVQILLKSAERPLPDLVHILARRSCEGLAEILWAVRGPCMILHRAFCGDLARVLVKSSLRGLCMILYIPARRSCGDPGGILPQALYDLAQILMRRSLEILVKSSLRAPCMILHRSLQGDLVKIVLKSFKRSLHDLVPVLVRRSCGDPVQIFPKRSLYLDLEAALHYRCLYGSSSGMPPGSSCMKVWKYPPYRWSFLTILWNSVWCPGMRFWYEVLHIELFVFKALASYLPILFRVSCQCNLAISLTLVWSALFFCWCDHVQPLFGKPPFSRQCPLPHRAQRSHLRIPMSPPCWTKLRGKVAQHGLGGKGQFWSVLVSSVWRKQLVPLYFCFRFKSVPDFFFRIVFVGWRLPECAAMRARL